MIPAMGESSLFAIVGLGNPGRKYRKTRHNIGFMVVDRLADRREVKIDRFSCRSLVRELEIAGQDVVLAKPQTYMNRSGEAVFELVEKYSLDLDRLLIIYDDVDLPLGRLRLKARGSAGSHNGMRSVLSSIESEELPRLRIGVSTGENLSDLSSFVLGRFRWKERHQVKEVLSAAQSAVELYIKDGMEKAMNRVNRSSVD